MKKIRGFTLIELIMVIVLTGILAAALTVFLRPAIDSYLDTRRRADLSDMADTALRRMSQDIRSAVPNSIRMGGAACFQFVPTITGGRYRKAPDTTVVSANSAALDTTTTTTVFDVLSLMRTLPAVGDWVVINNQDTNDVYNGTNRSQITGIQTPPNPGGTAVGQHRITIAPRQFSTGYDDGRFVVVSNAEQTVSYSCNGGTLFRTPAAFGAVQCAPTANSAVVATDVQGCTFTYTPNQGATQQSGFIELQLTLGRAGESITLSHGVHVENVP
jgi:MSHA biogenesis protein MshO